MNSIFTLLLVAILTAPVSCRAIEENNILAAGDWSEAVAGAQDHHTGRGAHRPIIRGRLLLCESPKNHQTAAYLELQDCGDTWGGSTEIYCDMGGFRLELTDTKGQPLPPRGFKFSGGSPGAQWMTLPCDTTIRLRISPYASFSYASTDDYFMSGSFVVDPPADHTSLDVWQGTLKLPAMKIVVPKTTDTADGTGKTSDEPASSSNGEKPDPIDQLVAKLSATDGLGSWLNGSYPVIRLPETATPEQILEQVFKLTGFDKGHVKDFKTLQSRNVQITGGSYTAALVQTDLGRKIVLFTAGGAWSRVYDADEPATKEPPAVTEPAKPLSQEEIGRVLEQIHEGKKVDRDTLHRALISEQTYLRASAARMLEDVEDYVEQSGVRLKYLLDHDPSRIVLTGGMSRFANFVWTEADTQALEKLDPAYALLEKI